MMFDRQSIQYIIIHQHIQTLHMLIYAVYDGIDAV